MNTAIDEEISQRIADAVTDDSRRDAEANKAVLSDQFLYQINKLAHENGLSPLDRMKCLLVASVLISKTTQKFLEDGLVNRTAVLPVSHGWVPIKELVPQFGQRVIIIDEDGMQKFASRRNFTSVPGDTGWELDEPSDYPDRPRQVSIDHATHWMPSPEAP